MEFTEIQRFRQWWVWLLMAGILGLICWAFIQQIILGVPWGNHPAKDYFLYIIIVFVALIIALLLTCRLETRIDKEGIHYRFLPFYFRMRSIGWDKIESVSLREHRPIGEYGGWGIRGTGRNRALTISGRSGFQIRLKDGRELFIGTQKPAELEDALQKLGKL